MSQILERLIEQQARPRIQAYSREKKAQAVKTLGPLIAAAGGTSSPHGNLGKEFDELLYDIIIPSVAEAVQIYLTSNVFIAPGQAVTVVGPTGAMVGSTTSPWKVTAP